MIICWHRLSNMLGLCSLGTVDPSTGESGSPTWYEVGIPAAGCGVNTQIEAAGM